MGWTTYHVEPEYRNGKYVIDRKAECDNTLNWNDIDHESGKMLRKYEVLKSAMVGSTHYAAVRVTKYAADETPEFIRVFAAITLTSVNNNHWHNFSYKPMSEDMVPFQCKCPKSILDLLTPTDDECSLAWRENCRRYIEEKKNPDTPANLPIGSIIRFKRSDGTDVEICKTAPFHQFKRPFWKVCGEPMYVSPSRIPKEYEIVKRGGNT